MHIKIQVKPPVGDQIMNFMDIKLNICDFLSNNMPNPIGISVITEIRRVANLPYSCPIKGNFAYTIKNSTFSNKILPPYTPQFIKFNFSLNLFADSEPMAQILLQGSTGR
ncbi:uncharacterized protein LOC131997682 [Stomoxys calcitrans]|uniref:uncharacterized protein LOC131997682 n=1 Tax=Stomoxys calcitrans TaxID=35570 RepID=UPI0027E21ED3|nr:uncharacterized protein LOC131997682 [Stomoxys calcitrans]